MHTRNTPCHRVVHTDTVDTKHMGKMQDRCEFLKSQRIATEQLVTLRPMGLYSHVATERSAHRYILFPLGCDALHVDKTIGLDARASRNTRTCNVPPFLYRRVAPSSCLTRASAASALACFFPSAHLCTVTERSTESYLSVQCHSLDD